MRGLRRWWWINVRKRLPKPCPACGCTVLHTYYWVDFPYSLPGDYGWHCDHEGDQHQSEY